jgi:hypothetical protein
MGMLALVWFWFGFGLVLVWWQGLTAFMAGFDWV